MPPSLEGRRVALLEARMSGELAEVVRRSGGTPYNVPAVREAPIPDPEHITAFIDALCAGRFAVLVFLTGVGVAALCREADQRGRLAETLAALRRLTTVCRGPKPVAVLRRNGVQIDLTAPEPHTATELIDAMRALDLSGKGVGLLHYGERSATIAEAITARGARLEELCLYEWVLPDDLEPLRALVGELVAGRVDAIAFTSQIQVRHLFQVAADLGLARELTDAMNTRTIVASVGPVCTATLARFGVTPHVEPEHPKMGPLILRLTEFVSTQS